MVFSPVFVCHSSDLITIHQQQIVLQAFSLFKRCGMTEEVRPKGTPYGLAMGLLHEFADCLPAAVALLPDNVLWPGSSFTAQTFQLLDEAAAVLSALHAQHIPLALMVAADSAALVKVCLEDRQLLSQFSAVVSSCCGRSVHCSTRQQHATMTKSSYLYWMLCRWSTSPTSLTPSSSSQQEAPKAAGWRQQRR